MIKDIYLPDASFIFNAKIDLCRILHDKQNSGLVLSLVMASCQEIFLLTSNSLSLDGTRTKKGLTLVHGGGGGGTL